MTPLQQIAMGLLVVVLDGTGSHDTLPDPLGWLLVLPAVARLAGPARTAALAAGLVAAVVATATWLPAPRAAVAGVDPSLDWALLLVPDLLFAALLCRALGRGAADGGDPRAAAWCRTVGVAVTGLALAPVPFLATGRPVPGDLGLLLQLTWLVLVVLLFSWHRRPWAPQRRPRGGLDHGPRTPPAAPRRA